MSCSAKSSNRTGSGDSALRTANSSLGEIAMKQSGSTVRASNEGMRRYPSSSGNKEKNFPASTGIKHEEHQPQFFERAKVSTSRFGAAMTIMRAIALFVILAFSGCVIAAGFMTSPASANKMDGKPGGANVARYGPKSSPSNAKPPANTKKPPAQ
jgi:hypothetical protein